MLEALDSNRYERFVSSFTGTLRRGRSPGPTGPILEEAPDLVLRRYKKVRKDVKALTEDSPPEDFHDLQGRRQTAALRPRAAAGHLRQTGGEDGRSPQRRPGRPRR